MSSAPKPTDPKETSAAQTGTNVATGVANAWLQNMNEVTPDGTKSFDQTGSSTFTDPYTGKTYEIPRFTVTQTLSEQQQAIKDQNDAASLNLSTLGNDLSGTLGQQLTGNFELGNEAVESRLFELGSKRLDPMFSQRDEDLRTRLANQGIKAGSQAYDREMALAGQQQNDAYNQLLLQGRGQAAQELMAEDSQRINQIGALMSGGQVSQPNFMSGASVNGIQGTDNAAIIANADNAALNSWQQSQAAMGSAIGGIGGLFSLSDERAKEDKQKIGETEDGMGIYSFKYKGKPKTEIGLMAQEVKKKKPGAVKKRPDGLFAVDYGKALA
ncbi:MULTISPECIES: tail fiber domain-containing protein [unclassified Sulfitobacter]|uniref:virion structural protein n=1 Tax=Sulfitobacter phage NYA-2014a TaxID=1526550 RepID=UPI0004F80BB5|nr:MULTISPECIES: tail fiber domain-containing protein [unclassified Sulfitobacter]YP_009146194.1 virion structural protein [Sulfitobacter phage NYA-2014a]AIM40651.1 peptidase_S74-domain containing protein [Sulfitobacter phage NYA-2014a]